jgi:glucan 1,3-beta-glucosidase
MSFRKEQVLSLKPETQASYIAGETEETLKDLFAEILANGVHGFCFSLYEDGQKPGDIISEQQVRRRMEKLKPYIKWVRSFSCTEGNEFIPKVAKELGIKTLVGAWLGNDAEINEREINGLIELANNGYVDIAAVGNEVMYRKDLTEEELLQHIAYVKAQIPNIPVGYVDAYYEFSHRPNITNACDVILCNCYPFWEGCPFEHSLAYMQQMYYQAKAAANGKEVIITETGWPSKGENLRGAIPSEKSARDYFINTQLWSANDNIPTFYFSSFDESWKVGAEGTVGAYWGIWDKHENLKF